MGLAIGTKRRRWRTEPADENDPKEQIKVKLILLRVVVLAPAALHSRGYAHWPVLTVRQSRTRRSAECPRRDSNTRHPL